MYVSTLEESRMAELKTPAIVRFRFHVTCSNLRLQHPCHFLIVLPSDTSPHPHRLPIFTPTMASSEKPLSITATFLLRLEHRCRSYNGSVQTALHWALFSTLLWGIRSRTFFAHLPPISYRITERILGFGNRRYLALL